MPARVLTRPALLMTMTDIAELADKPRPADYHVAPPLSGLLPRPGRW